MASKRSNRDILGLPDGKLFSECFNDALIKTTMIDEMARADNWQSLDECLEFRPKQIRDFARYADAALRALRNLNKTTTTN
jgi:hypothetical protein